MPPDPHPRHLVPRPQQRSPTWPSRPLPLTLKSNLLATSPADLPKNPALILLTTLVQMAKHLGCHLRPVSLGRQDIFPPLSPHSLNCLSPSSSVLQINCIYLHRFESDLSPENLTSTESQFLQHLFMPFTEPSNGLQFARREV